MMDGSLLLMMIKKLNIIKDDYPIDWKKDINDINEKYFDRFWELLFNVLPDCNNLEQIVIDTHPLELQKRMLLKKTD
jgi:hypothetical protein